MNRITLANEVPAEYQPAGFRILLRRLEVAFNALAGGSLVGRFSAAAAPTTGTWARGDIVYNSEPTELTGLGSFKYVLLGWICTAAGTPGTWFEMRVGTGN